MGATRNWKILTIMSDRRTEIKLGKVHYLFWLKCKFKEPKIPFNGPETKNG